MHPGAAVKEARDAPQARVSSVFISAVAQRLFISHTLAFRQVAFGKKFIFGTRAAQPRALTPKPAAAAAPKAVMLQAQPLHGNTANFSSSERAAWLRLAAVKEILLEGPCLLYMLQYSSALSPAKRVCALRALLCTQESWT